MARRGSERGPDRGEEYWRRIKATVTPLQRQSPPIDPDPKTAIAHAERVAGSMPIARGKRPASGERSPWMLKQVQHDELMGRGTKPPGTLDGTWERQLRGGRLSPDLTIDLHGHSLSGAHTHLSRALDEAVARGARVLLLIAGKVRGPDEAPRGAIRRELESWLTHSRHATRIAAVRGAHPRHGGAGALYIILKKNGG